MLEQIQPQPQSLKEAFKPKDTADDLTERRWVLEAKLQKNIRRPDIFTEPAKLILSAAVEIFEGLDGFENQAGMVGLLEKVLEVGPVKTMRKLVSMDEDPTRPTYTDLTANFWKKRKKSKIEETKEAQIDFGAFINHNRSQLLEIEAKMSEIRPHWQPDSIAGRMVEEEFQALWEEAARQLDNPGDFI